MRVINSNHHFSKIALPLFGFVFLSVSEVFAQTSLTTYHNDQARDGWNQNETILTTANVNSTSFGKLFSDAVDGQVYAQPLYMPNVSIGGGTHNVVYVETEHDSAYAFDADNAGVTYWHDSFITGAGVTTVSATTDAGGCPQVTPEIGITDTPVIDPSTGTIYFVAMTKTVSGGVTTFSQTLHALDITTGTEKFSGPQTIGATFPGTNGSGASAVTFVPQAYKERCALALVNGVVYTSWTGHCDNNGIAGNYHGWVIGYNASNITKQVSVFNASPNGSESSFWESGDGPSVDSAGNLYYLVANGIFDQTAPVSDYGQCFLKLNTSGNSVTVLDYFAPYNQSTMSSADNDVGSAGQCLLPASWGTTAHPNLMLGADKPGDLYVVDADTGSMGKFSTTTNNVPQTVAAIGGKGYTTAAIYSNGTTNYVYWGMTGSPLKAFTFANGQYVTPYSSATTESFASPSGCVPSVSSNGNSNGIVWALSYGTPVTLHAYTATNLGTELYYSGQASGNRDSAVGAAVKFAPPSVVNGKVYVPTANSLVVYGLLSAPSPTPTGSPVMTATPTASRTPTATASTTATSTPTRTVTLTATSTPTLTSTFTASRTPTTTASMTATSTPTLTVTNTVIATSTNTVTQTTTMTVSATPSFTPTFTLTRTATSTATATVTLSSTPTVSKTPTTTASMTSTSSPTLTPSNTVIATSTNTATQTATLTVSGTPSSTASSSATSSLSFTATPTASPTATATQTITLTNTNTALITPTLTFTPSQTTTSSVTRTATSTSTLTVSLTQTATSTATVTNSPTTTETFTPTFTGTVPPTDTPTWTPTASNTPSSTPSFTVTSSSTKTSTPTASSTPSNTSVNTVTSTPTATLTNTITLTLTSTSTVTRTFTPVFTNTSINTATSTSTATPTPTNSPTSSPTFTSTLQPSFTSTPSSTLTTEPSPTIPLTTAATPGVSSTPIVYPNPAPGGAPVTLLLNLSSITNVRIEIFTVAFRKVVDETIPNVPVGTVKLPVPLVDNQGKPLANGLYYVLITANGKRSVLKLLILG